MNYAMRRCFLSPEFSQFKVESVAAAAAATSRIFCAISRLCGLAQKATCSSRRAANLLDS